MSFLVNDYFIPPRSALENVDVFINFTGLVKATPAELHRVNAAGPAMLAKAARDADASHFIHISSLSVYGGAEDIDFSTVPVPVTAYGQSKLLGEQRLAELIAQDFAVTSLRVPILYNKTARGKLHQLANMMSRLRFFPVPRVPQPRSILHFDNLAAAIEAILDTRIAGVRFAADPEPFTFSNLADGIQRRHGYRPKLVIIPGWILYSFGKLAGTLHLSLYTRSLIAKDSLILMAAAKGAQQCIDDIVMAPTED